MSTPVFVRTPRGFRPIQDIERIMDIGSFEKPEAWLSFRGDDNGVKVPGMTANQVAASTNKMASASILPAAQGEFLLLAEDVPLQSGRWGVGISPRRVIGWRHDGGSGVKPLTLSPLPKGSLEEGCVATLIEANTVEVLGREKGQPRVMSLTAWVDQCSASLGLTPEAVPMIEKPKAKKSKKGGAR